MRPLWWIFLMGYFAMQFSGCASVTSTLGPEPNSPQAYFTVDVDSIPQGADVYSISADDGSLGTKIGSTPLELRIGMGFQVWETPPHNPTAETVRTKINGEVAGGYTWSPGNCVSFVRSGSKSQLTNSIGWKKYVNDWEYWLNIALIKDGFHTKKISKKVGDAPNIYLGYRADLPKNITLTVPLQPLATEPSKGSVQQQQQQQQQQTIIFSEPGSKTSRNQGVIILSSLPENAEVHVDGFFAGNTPCRLSLADGIHVIEFKHKDFSPYKREIRVFSGSDASINAVLKPSNDINNNRSDSYLRKMIVGTWIKDDALFATIKYEENGRHEVKIYSTSEKNHLLSTNEGKWWIEKGRLYTIINKADPPNDLVGKVYTAILIEISTDQYTLLEEDGHRTIRKREH